MELIQGNREASEQNKADKRKARRDRWREIMLASNDPQKVFHAAARWYASREKWETDSKAEFIIYSAMVKLLAQEFSPEWIAREFPAVKEYKGHTWGAKDYTTSMETLQGAEPFNGDEGKVNEFLWGWDNHVLMGFIVAGMTIMDEIRAMRGERSMVEEWAEDVGVKAYHSVKVNGSQEIMLDEDGRSLGVVHRKRPRHLKAVK